MEAGQLDLAAGAGLQPTWARLWRWIGVSPPAGTSSLPPFSVLSSMFVGWGGGREMVLPLPQHLPLPRKSPFPPLPHRRQRKGREVGGQGSPSVLRLHRVFRLNQEIFYYQKEKRKKKKSQRPPFLPAPLGQLRLDLWGFPGGWLRAGTLSGKSGGVPCQALRQAHFGLLPSPSPLPLQANHQRWPSPDLRPPGWRPTGPGWGRGAVLPWGGGRGWGAGSCPGLTGEAQALAPSILYPLPLLPQSWAFPSTSCCGDFCSPPQNSVPSSPTPPG